MPTMIISAVGILAAKCDNCDQFCYFHYQNEKETSKEVIKCLLCAI